MSKGKKIFWSAIAGNIVEYYDFTAYSLFITVISSNFFHTSSELYSIFMGLVTFSVGFLTRPIGGIFFGYIGDAFGRKSALILCSVGMSFSTLLMGLLPTYESLGVYSSVVLILIRLIQGLCISGEGTGTAIFLLEHFTKNKAGVITGIIQGTSMIGTLMAGSLSLLLSICISDIDSLLKMRIVYIIGGLLGLFAFYLRMKISETPVFKKIQHEKSARNSFFYIIRSQWKRMLLTVIVASCAGSLLQFIKGYTGAHFHNLDFCNNMSNFFLTYASVNIIVFTLIFGFLIDKYIRVVQMLFISCLSTITLAIPCLILISCKNVCLIFIGLTFLSMLSASMCVPAYIFTISLFEPKNRFFGVSFSYNLGLAMFAGTSPVISQLLVKFTSNTISPSLYLILTSLILTFALYFSKDLYKETYLES